MDTASFSPESYDLFVKRMMQSDADVDLAFKGLVKKRIQYT